MNAFTTCSAALVLACSTWAAHAQGTVLSPQHAACMRHSGDTTMGMIDCIAAETQRQDRRLNQAYKAAMALQSPERKKQLRAAQRAWIQFRDANCAFYFDPGGGSLARVSANDCVMTSTAQRAQELEGFAVSH